MTANRSLPPLDLAWNPLVFVLGQVVTSAVLRIEDYVPDLQEHYRKSGYPGFNQVETQTVRVGDEGPIDIGREKRWIFYNKSQSKSIVIGSGLVVLQSSEYSRFEDFLEELSTIVAIFQDIVAPEIYERLGFRRINLLEDFDALPIDQAVRQGLHGLGDDVFASAHQQRLEHWGDTGIGRMMVRLMRPAPPSVVPQDLLTIGLDLRKPIGEGRQTATLDIDHFRTGSGDFSVDEIAEVFWQLHHPSDQAFRNCVTEEALEVWRKGSPSDSGGQ